MVYIFSTFSMNLLTYFTCSYWIIEYWLSRLSIIKVNWKINMLVKILKEIKWYKLITRIFFFFPNIQTWLTRKVPPVQPQQKEKNEHIYLSIRTSKCTQCDLKKVGLVKKKKRYLCWVLSVWKWETAKDYELWSLYTYLPDGVQNDPSN